MHHYSPFVIAIALLAFVTFWLALTRLIRRMSRMTDSLPADAGAELRRSGWGSAVINGSRAGNCVRVIEYANGHAVKMHRVFGGGLVWLPKAQTTLRRDGPNSLLLTHGVHGVQLNGLLADFVAGPPGRATAAPTSSRPTDSGDRTPRTAPLAPVQRLSHERGSSAWSRAAIWTAIALLLFVVLRRTAPEFVAPIEHFIQGVQKGI